MKVIFHERFYEVYTYDPAAAEGRMEAMVRSLKGEFEFVEPEPALERDIERVHGRAHIQTIKGDPLLYDIALLPLEEPFWQAMWLTMANRPLA